MARSIQHSSTLIIECLTWQTGVLITADVSCIHTRTPVTTVAFREGASRLIGSSHVNTV